MKWICHRLLPALIVLVTGSANAALEVAALEVKVAALEVKEADSPATLGRAVFEEADRRASDYRDLEVSLRMILRTAKGRATERALRIRQLEVPDDADKVLVVFDTPANIRGTALLSHGHKFSPDDQWLFLPALKRTKKIASRNKSGPFLGSEFSFEDLSAPALEKYTYRHLRDETLEGVECYVVERVSTEEYSGYTREVFWIDKSEFRTQRVEYFDRRDTPLKRLEVSDYALYEEAFWKPRRMVMTNLRSHKSTELIWQDYTFGVGFSAERDFSVSSLRRAR